MTPPPVALVVGGSRGLGLLIAKELTRRGYRVVIASRTEDELESGLRQLQQIRGPAGQAARQPEKRVCDVRDRESVRRLVDDVETTVGPIDTVFTVAGIIQVGPAESMTFDHFEDAINTMAWGPINVALTVLPRLRERRRGHIGTVTSIGGMVSPPHLLPYATAKFAAVGFSDGLAAELQGTGVTATTIVPGLMRTGSHLRARFAGAAEKEFAWFGPAASLPGLSMDAERAARRMVDAVLAGKPMVMLSPLTHVGVRVHGLLPGTTTRLMGLANRLLPGPAEGSDARTGTIEGREAERRLDSPIVNALTTWGRRAAQRFNERP
ncbi:SDR family oxidoreductase [Intrasporangium sp. DVR]|uniref:SDR family NAD(P)-dependent oxidoreductase n=1 Tax=Intrasporangium sp. DVR TaxID=3127867 RepID=UPI00313A532B